MALETKQGSFEGNNCYARSWAVSHLKMHEYALIMVFDVEDNSETEAVVTVLDLGLIHLLLT